MSTIPWPRLFRIIWRINGAALLLLLLLALVGLSGTLLSGLFRTSRGEEVQAPGVAPAAEGEPELRLGAFQPVGDTGVLRADLRSPSGDSFGGYKGGGGAVHNVLFVDASNGKSWWLLPHSGWVIESEQAISVQAGGMEAPLAKVFHLVDEAMPKASSLRLTDVKGLKQTTLAIGDLGLDEVIASSRTVAQVVYHDAGGYRLVTVNPTDLVKVREVPLAIAFPPRR